MKHQVTAILTHHLNRNQHYLNLALKSLLNQKDVDLEIILVASSVEDPIVPEGVKVVRVPHTMMTTEAYSLGVKEARASSTFFVIANDDIIVSQSTIAHMAATLWRSDTQSPQPGILNSFSNDGWGQVHFTDPLIKHPKRFEYLPMGFQAPFELIAEYYDSIVSYPGLAPVLTTYPLNCFYFTMIPRKVWELVGGLDLEICGKQKSSHEDVDFCLRAKQKGIVCLNTFGSFVWHFGGVTVQHTMTQEDREQGQKAYCQKWNIPYEHPQKA